MARGKKQRLRQLTFEERMWGGARRGAGRPRKEEKDRKVPHVTRVPLAARFPAHVTTKLVEGLPSLRRRETIRVLMQKFSEGCERAGSLGSGFRLVHFSVQSNHLHMLVEAEDRLHLVRGVQGMLVRLAKALNKLWGRKGKVFLDRYHDHILRTPMEVKRALQYVLQNALKHGVLRRGPDPYSSGRWFDGWRNAGQALALAFAFAPVTGARTWLMRLGWRRHGLLDPSEPPAIDGP